MHLDCGTEEKVQKTVNYTEVKLRTNDKRSVSSI